MTHEEPALPRSLVHTSELQDVIFSLTRRSSDKNQSIKILPRMNQSGLVPRPKLSQSNGGPIYPLTVWHSLGANVYFEPMRALRTAFSNPQRKKTQTSNVKRNDRVIVVQVLSVLDCEKFVRFPELPKGSINRSPRPIASLSHPAALARINHNLVCKPEQKYSDTGHIQDRRTKFGSDLPKIYGPTVSAKRLTEPTKRIRLSINCRSCAPLTQRHYSTNLNGSAMSNNKPG
ncbi:uncharacterized protein [Pyxicephalus adspersus]|uniref:uncharacterized protein n=1 Tax=Pyxicephalus adspersus TaxID=30357 RepID=UPI003B5A4770